MDIIDKICEKVAEFAKDADKYKGCFLEPIFVEENNKIKANPIFKEMSDKFLEMDPLFEELRNKKGGLIDLDDNLFVIDNFFHEQLRKNLLALDYCIKTNSEDKEAVFHQVELMFWQRAKSKEIYENHKEKNNENN